MKEYLFNTHITVERRRLCSILWIVFIKMKYSVSTAAFTMGVQTYKQWDIIPFKSGLTHEESYLRTVSRKLYFEI